MVRDLDFRVKGSGFKVRGVKFTVSKSWVEVIGFGVSSSGLWI
jgi:hypothetical protein